MAKCNSIHLVPLCSSSYMGPYIAAGQERFRTLTSSYYRGAQGIIMGIFFCNRCSPFAFCILIMLWTYISLVVILSFSVYICFFSGKASEFLLKNGTVYDVTRRETFTNLSDIWAKEIDLYSTSQDCIKMLVGNKVDKVCLVKCTLCIFIFLRRINLVSYSFFPFPFPFS